MGGGNNNSFTCSPPLRYPREARPGHTPQVLLLLRKRHVYDCPHLCCVKSVGISGGPHIWHSNEPPPLPSGEDAMGGNCILDSPPVRMPACHSRRFKGERPIGAATG